MSYYSEECVDQERDLTSEVKVDEDPMPISFRMAKHEPEDRYFSDQHVTGIKEEYVAHSHGLTTEIKFEEDPEPFSFPVVKREPEEEQSGLDTVNEEPRVEGTAEDNEIFTEWIAATKERTVSSEFNSFAHEENDTVCEIPKNSNSSGEHAATDEDKKPLQFEISKGCLSNPAKSTTHLSERVVKNGYKCDICGKSFSTSRGVKRHEFLHTGEKPFSCDVCGKCFSQSSHLRCHERLHTGEKTFKCDVCGNYFSRSSNLRRHERLHTSEKPFRCDVCGRCFSASSSLRRHKLGHIGDKPFKCDDCGKCFSQLSHVRRHELVHTGEKPFKCDVCGKCFSRSSHLKRHELLHIGGKTFKCQARNVTNPVIVVFP
ncbi:zinc finger protein 235-like isoform X2 [Periplaneta americana]|uniref:zinc finger protein 235-like isoform X2 n=1 Tax=Periplaneta americana TaxID=6978 RepID=UPI0037E73DA3